MGPATPKVFNFIATYWILFDTRYCHGCRQYADFGSSKSCVTHSKQRDNCGENLIVLQAFVVRTRKSKDLDWSMQSNDSIVSAL